MHTFTRIIVYVPVVHRDIMRCRMCGTFGQKQSWNWSKWKGYSKWKTWQHYMFMEHLHHRTETYPHCATTQHYTSTSHHTWNCCIYAQCNVLSHQRHIRRHHQKVILIIMARIDHSSHHQIFTCPRCHNQRTHGSNPMQSTHIRQKIRQPSPGQQQWMHTPIIFCNWNDRQNIYRSEGTFPVTSSTGHKYVFIMYVYNNNAILAEPIKNSLESELAQVHEKIIGYLQNIGFRLRVHWLDNESPQGIKTLYQEKGIN